MQVGADLIVEKEKRKKNERLDSRCSNSSIQADSPYADIHTIIDRHSRGLHSNSNIKREQSPLSRIPSESDIIHTVLRIPIVETRFPPN